MTRKVKRFFLKGTLLLSAVWLGYGGVQQVHQAQAQEHSLLNVSYDPTRELYQDIDKAFTKTWNTEHPKDTVIVHTSHGGSAVQARAVLDGAPADVVTLCLAYDIDVLAQHGLLPIDWQRHYPHESIPYTSIIVFLVRKGNPKNIHNWPDLVKNGVQVIIPNPKTSGEARWDYLAAWGWALRQPGGDAETGREYIRKLFEHVPILNTGARGATNTFVQRGQGDVLVTLENEALLATKKLGAGQFDIVIPPMTIQTNAPVAMVTRNVQKHGTKEIADAYLNFLFTPEGQRIGAEHYFRPTDPQVKAEFEKFFPKTNTFDIRSLGGWAVMQKEHFADGAMFDQVTASGK